MAQPVIDLTGTKYDALETDLTQFLGLKVFLVRGWSGESGKEDLRSLRDNIAARDPSLGFRLSNKDLMSIRQEGHVTVRHGNTEMEEAVIIFDPFSTPAETIATISIGAEKKAEFNITAAPPSAVEKPARDAALAWAFPRTYVNFWNKRAEQRPLVKDIVENFDIDVDDIRRYTALMNVRYALRHQHDFHNRDRFSNDDPMFFTFAGLGYGRSRMNAVYSQMTYSEAYERLNVEIDLPEEFGLKDAEFFKKLKSCGAIMNLVHNVLQPYDTFARIDFKGEASAKQIDEIREDLRNRLHAKAEEFFPEYDAANVIRDWRILFPVFREVYQADTGTGMQRRYLDTIMEGLQRFFPTITNASVPAADRSDEPPRDLSPRLKLVKSTGPAPKP